MGFNMLRVGVTESLPMILGFLALALCAILLGSKAVASAGLQGGNYLSHHSYRSASFSVSGAGARHKMPR
jgi:hypothetical protein